MKRVLNGLLVLIALSALAVSTIYFIYPGVLLNAVQSMSANGAGLEKRVVKIDGYESHYYEGGSSNQTTLVLLHDFGDNKHSFVTSIRQLTQQYRVILPDLQGHGDNEQRLGRDYSIAGQAQFLDQLLRKLNANRVFIGGHSMGGHIALSFAAGYPEKSRGLILLNSKGLQLENESLYQAYPNDVDALFFETLFTQNFVTPPSFPKPILQYRANQLNPKIPFFNALIKQMESGNDVKMNEQVALINAPTLILWGMQDPILPPSYAQLFTQNLANSTLVKIENVGHSPQFEAPDKVQSEITLFLESH